MVKKIFCDICGHELTASEAIQLLSHELCASCCKELVPLSGARYKTET